MHGNASPLEAQHQQIGTELLPLDCIRKPAGVLCSAALLSAQLTDMWQVKKSSITAAETASKHIINLSKYTVQKIIYIQTQHRQANKEHSSINKQLLQQLLLKLMACFPIYHLGISVFA